MPLSMADKILAIQKARQNYSWAANFTDEDLLRMVEKNPQFFDLEPNPFFVYGKDPITGKVIPTMAKWSMPTIGIALAIVALFFVMRMK